MFVKILWKTKPRANGRMDARWRNRDTSMRTCPKSRESVTWRWRYIYRWFWVGVITVMIYVQVLLNVWFSRVILCIIVACFSRLNFETRHRYETDTLIFNIRAVFTTISPIHHRTICTTVFWMLGRKSTWTCPAHVRHFTLKCECAYKGLGYKASLVWKCPHLLDVVRPLSRTPTGVCVGPPMARR